MRKNDDSVLAFLFRCRTLTIAHSDLPGGVGGTVRGPSRLQATLRFVEDDATCILYARY